ncbi:MAG: hypothetical protein O9322_08240 [Beijerinckiaceae bacterium]|nr:hypothetical protein [Beijerinckiaceae bacterium]MCZ8301101.1 hypothetical protein [Beijerinckiaceae bacterium]
MRSWRFPSVNAAFWLALVLAAAAPLPAVGQGAPRIAVEAGGIGLPAISAHIRRSLPRALAREMAEQGKPLPAGTRLVIRVSQVVLASEPGLVGRGSFGTFAPGDGIDGEALLIDRQGNVLARRTVAGRSPANSGGFGPAPYNEPRRVEALIGVFAYWIIREM